MGECMKTCSNHCYRGGYAYPINLILCLSSLTSCSFFLCPSLPPLSSSPLPWPFEMLQQKTTPPLVLWRQATDGSVRTAPCASLGGTGPGTASPTLTTSPSPCWQCSSASPWRAGQMCCTGYVPWNTEAGSPEGYKDFLPSTLLVHPSHDFDGEVDEFLWFLSGLLWETKHEMFTLMSLSLPTSLREMPSFSVSSTVSSEKLWHAPNTWNKVACHSFPHPLLGFLSSYSRLASVPKRQIDY